jgi:hypothetical protein
VFLAGRRAPLSGPRAPAGADVCPETRRGRLSYPRAEYLFKQATAAHDPHRQGWTLHQLRPPAPGRRRTHRPRTPGQIPAHAPGQPRPLRPARRADLRPGHRRRRPRSTTQDSLTKPG